MPRIRVGTKVLVSCDQSEDILRYMGLVDQDNNIIPGIHMHGTVKASSGPHWIVNLVATQKNHYFVKGDRVQFVSAPPSCPTYYCVVNKEIQEIDGLELPSGCAPNGYYLHLTDAEKELNNIAKGTVEHCCVCARIKQL